MPRIPIDRSSDLQRLRDAGFNFTVTGAAFLVVHDIPYVNSKGQIAFGAVATNLDLAGDITVQPADHTAKFIGEHPCDSKGAELGLIKHTSGTFELGDNLVAQYSFSRKPTRGHYLDYYEKMTTYISMIMEPALAIDPSVSPRTRRIEVPEVGESPFNYLDTASARSEINSASSKLAGLKIAIVGLGGTGSYILDAIAKTPVSEIHLFDADVMLTHNAFRAPGAPSLEELRQQHPKVEYLTAIYSRMHRGIVPRQLKLDADNVALLNGMAFVFLSMDSGEPKRAIIAQLEDWGTPFIDVGMGLYVKRNRVGGILRAVSSLPDAREEARQHISMAQDNLINEYDKNVQVAELNALNACLAVISWKKHFGYYADTGHERTVSYSVANSLLTKSDVHEG